MFHSSEQQKAHNTQWVFGFGSHEIRLMFERKKLSNPISSERCPAYFNVWDQEMQVGKYLPVSIGQFNNNRLVLSPKLT